MDQSANLVAGQLWINGKQILAGVSAEVSCVERMTESSVLLEFEGDVLQSEHFCCLGHLPELKRFEAHFRYEPFWMKPRVGTVGSEIPRETQFLLVELASGVFVIFVPLISDTTHCSLGGSVDGALNLYAVSGDTSVGVRPMTGLFVALGTDVYELVRRSAKLVCSFQKDAQLRVERPMPRLATWLGWCTWDAFYNEVSEENVRLGLASFQRGGVTPRVLIVDDGWLSVRKLPDGERVLTSFAPNDQFCGDLGPTIQMAKQEFGVELVLVWHALAGYWGGVDPSSFPDYLVRRIARKFSAAIIDFFPGCQGSLWGLTVGVVDSSDIARFFQKFHASLRAQGVDGLKVDAQSMLEGVAEGSGGRVALMRAYRKALENSSHEHFGGELINCMSCSTDVIYQARGSNVLRTSTDFWPDIPTSHGLHLYTNAHISLWFGEFIYPDWDMFQSGHSAGAYHAAARAISGGPIYVSDKVDGHDFKVLKKLCLPNGTLLRCTDPGRPTLDCLFRDPTKENMLLKIFNRNETSAVVGVFNARFRELPGRGNDVISGKVSPQDVPGLLESSYVLYGHTSQQMSLCAFGDSISVALPQLEWELFTIVPAANGFAPIGLVEMYNSGGSIFDLSSPAPGHHTFSVRWGGRLVAWCNKRPMDVKVNGRSTLFTYNLAQGALDVEMLCDGIARVEVFVEHVQS